MTLWNHLKDLMDNLRTIPNDAIIVVVVGPTGSGRSTFINKAIGSEKCDASSNKNRSQLQSTEAATSLDPITKSFQRVYHKRDARNFVFVDTPGLDVEMVPTPGAFGKAAKLPSNRRADALVYLHRINLPRVTTSPKDHAKLFKNLCGEDWAKKLIVATTMWSESGETKADERHRQIKQTFWEGGIENGAQLDRFDESNEDAWRIIDRVIPQPPQCGSESRIFSTSRSDITLPVT